MQISEEQLRNRVWYNPINGEFYKGELYSGQVYDITQVSTIQAKVVLEDVLGLARPQYNLRAITRIIRMPQLVMSVDKATKLVGQKKVPALVEATIVTESYTRVDFDLWKNVTHVVISDEARLKATHDVLRLHIEDAAREIAKMENDQIVAEAETATAIAGADWGAVSGTPPESTNNPFDDINKALDAVWANGYPPDFMALHPRPWADFITNKFTRGMAQAGLVTVGPNGGSFTLPGYPTVKVVVDYALTNTSALIGSTQGPAVMLGEGPTESARYRDEKRGYDAFIIRQWLQPKLVNTDAIRKLTGVSA